MSTVSRVKMCPRVKSTEKDAGTMQASSNVCSWHHDTRRQEASPRPRAASPRQTRHAHSPPLRLPSLRLLALPCTSLSHSAERGAVPQPFHTVYLPSVFPFVLSTFWSSCEVLFMFLHPGRTSLPRKTSVVCLPFSMPGFSVPAFTAAWTMRVTCSSVCHPC